MQIEINDILKEAEVQIKNLALATASKYSDEAAEAGKKLLSNMQADLQKWAQMVAAKEMTEPEFEVLVKSYNTEIVVASLEQAGMASIKATQLALNILDVIIDVSIKIISKLV